MQCYQQAIAAQPEHAQAYNNLGTLYRLQGDYVRARQCYEKTLEMKPNSAEALNNLGNVFKLQGRVTEAAVCYDETLRIEPGYAQAHYNRGLVLLAEGEFAEGWAEYEWRLQCPEFEQRGFDVPRWGGEPLAGRTLLVYAEQGLGDTLQFCAVSPPGGRPRRTRRAGSPAGARAAAAQLGPGRRGPTGGPRRTAAGVRPARAAVEFARPAGNDFGEHPRSRRLSAGRAGAGRRLARAAGRRRRFPRGNRLAREPQVSGRSPALDSARGVRTAGRSTACRW